MVDRIIKTAFEEDLGDGDHSSLSCIPKEAIGEAKLIVKDKGIIAGVELAEKIFKSLDESLEIQVLIQDGENVDVGDIVFIVKGSSRSILDAERIVLNFMQRMSGIATQTSAIVELIEGTDAKLLDTRKTTPCLRYIEKWAVRIGGGHNHRFGLYDMIMLKDNHIDFCGGITNAIQQTKEYLLDNHLNLKIIVEARNLKEIEEILQSEGVYRILIDNFNYEDTKTAVALIGDKCLTESSGGITLETVKKYAECGVDFISSGAITHSIYNMDLSLKAI